MAGGRPFVCSTANGDEQEYGWKIAVHASYTLGKYGRGAATKLAREAGISAGYVRRLAATARVFPEDMRNPTLSRDHHRVAAETVTRKVWQKRERQWSVREMENAIKDRQVDEDYRIRSTSLTCPFFYPTGQWVFPSNDDFF